MAAKNHPGRTCDSLNKSSTKAPLCLMYLLVYLENSFFVHMQAVCSQNIFWFIPLSFQNKQVFLEVQRVICAIIQQTLLHNPWNIYIYIYTSFCIFIALCYNSEHDYWIICRSIIKETALLMSYFWSNSARRFIQQTRIGFVMLQIRMIGRWLSIYVINIL